MRYNASQRRSSITQTLPAPVGGLNDIDPVAAMGAEYCLQLNDIFPATAGLQVRNGYKEYVTGLGAPIRTLANMARLDGTHELFACTNAGVYDVTVSADSPTIAIALTSGAVGFTNFTNLANNYLILVNGVDAAKLYDGTTWISFTEVATPTVPGEIHGVNPNKFSVVASYKNRLWFAENKSLTIWYLDTDSLSGTAHPLYLGGVAAMGGYIVDIATWSFDSGTSMDDLIVFRTSSGEAIIYTGTDPSDATKWALKSVYYVSPSAGKKSSVDIGGDVAMMTAAGVVQMSKVVQGVATEDLYENTMSRKINKTLRTILDRLNYVPDWELHNLSVLQALFIVIPASGSVGAQQFVLNLITGAWGRYTLPARCFGIMNTSVFFGGDDGTVYQFNTVTRDAIKRDGTGGKDIIGSFFTAYNYLGNPSTNKHFKLIRPIFQSGSKVSYIAQLNVDFDILSQPGSPPVLAPGGGPSYFDVDMWDEAVWSAANTTYRPWVGVLGMGYCAALLMKIVSKDAVQFVAVSVTYEEGTGI